MNFGIQTPPQHTPFSALRDLWQCADELGFAAAFTFDHLVPLSPGERPGAIGPRPPDGPQFEGWMALAALAAGTQRLQVGTLVTAVTYRHPAVLAKMVVTLDHATGGRAILGLGAGWHEPEHRMFGIDFPPVGERMGRLDEALHLFALLCRQDVVTFHGRYFQLEDAVFEPKPVRAGGVPVLVGGNGARLRRIAGRHATIYNSLAAPWEWPEVNTAIDQAARAVDRDPADISRSGYAFSQLSGDAGRQAALISQFCATRGGSEERARQRLLVGDPDQMVAVAQAYQNAGIELLIVNVAAPFDTEDLARFARSVMPVFAA